MESTLTAFDGAFLRLPDDRRADSRKATAVKASAIAADLQPLYALRPTASNTTSRSCRCSTTSTCFDDWTIPLANIRRARQGGARRRAAVGIVIDSEAWPGLRVNYPGDVKFLEPHARGLPRPDAADRAQDHAGDRRRVPGCGGRRPARPRRRRSGLARRPGQPRGRLGASSWARSSPASSRQGLRARWSSTAAPTTACAATEQFDASAAWRKTGLASARHRQRLPHRFAARPLADLGQRVVRRARARRRPRQPAAAQRADGVRQLPGAVAARCRHLRLGVVRPDRPDQGDGRPSPTSARRRRPGWRRRRRAARSPLSAPGQRHAACSPSTSR